MNQQEKEQYLKDFKKYMDKKTSSKEEAKKFLFELGIHDKDGNLTENYKQPE